MQIFIRNDKSLFFEFNPTTTIADVKNTYYQKTGIPSKYIILSYNGKNLYDTDPISKYNITNDTTIYMNIRMPLKKY